MAAKRVRISADDTTYYTLPGNQAEMRDEAGQLNDTIFGQNYQSNESGLINTTLNANALYKGFAGYLVKLYMGGTPTTMTAEACSLVSGKTYQITAATKRIIDFDTAVTVLDNAVNHTADVESIDYFTGKVTFKSAYTPTTPITITGKYIPMAEIAGSKAWTLTMTQEPIDTTDIPKARTNSGIQTFDSGLKTVSLELSGIYKTANAWRTKLTGRSKVYVEINPDNSDLSIARGMFKIVNRGQSGDVGALEEETINLSLNVDDEELMLTPFNWYHSVSTTLNQGIIKLLDAFLSGTLVYAQYLPDGTNGVKGQGVPIDVSLSGGLEVMNEFQANLQMSDALTAVP